MYTKCSRELTSSLAHYELEEVFMPYYSTWLTTETISKWSNLLTSSPTDTLTDEVRFGPLTGRTSCITLWVMPLIGRWRIVVSWNAKIIRSLGIMAMSQWEWRQVNVSGNGVDGLKRSSNICRSTGFLIRVSRGILYFLHKNITVVQYSFVEYEVLTAMVMKSPIFWDITPCSPLKVNRLSEGTCCLHLQGRRMIKQETRMKQVARSVGFQRTVWGCVTKGKTLQRIFVPTKLKQVRIQRPM
jgi:hypothetical protein